MPSENEPDVAKGVRELARTYPGISVQRDFLGNIVVTKSGPDGSIEMRLQARPVFRTEGQQEPSVAIDVFTQLDGAGSAVGPALGELVIEQGEDGVAVDAVKTTPELDIQECIGIVQRGFDLFSRYRELPKDAQMRVSAGKVYDEAKSDLPGELIDAGLDEGVATAMAGGISPEANYRSMSSLVGLAQEK